MPQTLTIITNTFPAERRGAAFGVWGAVAGVATIAGPTLGGLLVTAFDWRWIFFVNLPFGVIALILTFVIIPDMRPGRRHRIDIPGVLLASAGLLAICYGLVEGQKYNWGTITSFVSIPLVLGLGVLLLIVFLVQQWLTQDREPLVPFALFRDRNYAVVNWVSGTLAIGMMGIFLPFTIYLQSVLGFSALRAGLTMAPASVLSMFVAPVAGRLTDKIGGKYILMLGLILFGGGMGWVALEASTTSTWYDFLPALVVAGIGMGCVFAPMVTVAMRNIDPRMAGAASGVLNTIRQVGLVIGTAAVGALLQNRLVTSMNSQAATRAATLPPQLRGPFVAGIKHAASNGIQVGAGQNGSGIKLPPGLPARLMAELLRIGHDVFTFGYVNAMRSTMLLPVILLGVGAVSCLMLKGAQRPPERAPELPDVPAQEGAPAA
jgi:EmrB/QacA subfamily drug resistance transporter